MTGDGDAFDLGRFLSPAEERGGPHALYLPARRPASARDRLRMYDAVGEAAGAREGLAFAVAPALELVEHRLPRGVPWTRFPVLSDAALQLAPVPLPVVWLDEGASAEERLAERASWWEARERVALVVVDPWNGAVDAQEAAEAAARSAAVLSDPERGLAAVERVARIGADGHAAWEAGPAEAEERLAAGGRAGLRFAYSWRVNATTVLGRALAEAMRRAPEQPAGWAPAARGDPLADPLSVQLLFRLARGGPLTAEADVSGRWPCGGALDAVPLAPDRFDDVVRGLRGAGLVTLVSRLPDRLELTTLGAAYLALLDPSGDDPGVLGRWRDAETDVVPASAVPEMDAWLLRFFGGTKEALVRLGIR